MSVTTLLEEGIAAARAGRRDEARQLLTQLVEEDERNEQGWLWLAGVVSDPAEMRVCLENTLTLNPSNAKARQGLAWIDSRYGPAPEPVPAPAPVQVPAPMEAPAPVQAPAAEATHFSFAPQAAAPAPPPASAASSVPSGPPAFPARPQEIASAAEPATNEASNEVLPCVYCGAETKPLHERCPRCRKSLMVPAAPQQERSLPLTLLAILNGISSVLTILAGGFCFLFGVLFSVGSSALKGRPDVLAAEMKKLPPGQQLPSGFNTLMFLDMMGTLIYAIAFALLIGGILYLAVSFGLWRRRRWAYILAIISAVLGTIATVIILPLSLLTRTMSADTAISLIMQVTLIVLTFMSWGDFYPPMRRFVPEMTPNDAVGHYNNGVAYKERGMWYMAAQEWQAAVTKAPADLTYLHAAGLAYAQIRQLDQARSLLDQALAIAPNNPQIQESRALIESVAAPAT